LLQLHEDMEHLGPSLRRSRRREHPLVRALVALALSLGLNLLVSTLLDASLLGILSGQEARPVELSPLPAAAWEANRAIAPQRPVPPAPVPAPEDPARPRGQIVDIGPAPDGESPPEPPRDARYLAERNSRVEKETRARNPGLFDRTMPVPTAVVKPGGEAGAGQRSAPGRPGPRGSGAEAERLALAPPDFSRQPASREATGDLPGDEAPPEQRPAPAPGAGDGGERRAGRFDPRLATSPETLAKLAGGPSPDYLRDLDEGDGTFLNTREWRYATYFTRMRRSIYPNWKPLEEYVKRDPELSMFPIRRWITDLEVVLDDRGYVKRLTVLRPSGLDFLDRAAVDAFQAGSPYLNPPTALVENGEIRFEQGFVIDMSRIKRQLRDLQAR